MFKSDQMIIKKACTKNVCDIVIRCVSLTQQGLVRALACVCIAMAVPVAVANDVDQKIDVDAALTPVSAVVLSSDTLTANVLSSGCTNHNDFLIEFGYTEKLCFVTVVRKREDRCRMALHAVSIEIGFDPLEVCTDKPLFVRNPLLVLSENGRQLKRIE